MLETIRAFIYTKNLDDSEFDNEYNLFIQQLESLLQSAFQDVDEKSILTVHQVLYEINIAHLSVAWFNKAHNIHHPKIVLIKYKIDQAWNKSIQYNYKDQIQDLPSVDDFPDWIRTTVANHKSNELHPVFTFLRDEANLEQSKEFFFQETPLEMLFGDIIAYLLPGIYGGIKVEFVKNYWDEVGRGIDEKVHRKLRARMMKALNIDESCYLENTELFICEELELINMYLSLALDRTKHTELVGALLATELMIPGRFQYLIDGFRRLGFNDYDLHYHIEHTSVDEVHADDLLDHVAMPILKHDAKQMQALVLGGLRRLDTIHKVLDRLYERVLSNESSYHLVKAA